MASINQSINLLKSLRGIEVALSIRARGLCIKRVTKVITIIRYIHGIVDSYHPIQPSNNLDNKQLLDEVEHDIMNYQNRGLCYLPKPKAEADNTDTRF